MIKKTAIFISFLTLLTAALGFSYPNVKKFQAKYATRFYSHPVNVVPDSFYQYDPPMISVANLSHLPPAKAVPILMYHGVVQNDDGENTTEAYFIQQMEMLKRDGYKTITLKNLDDFLQGNFVLPPRPIVITFDDGRKDSYFATDDVLKKLGFNAAIFIVTGKQDEEDKFFLSWDNVKQMNASGRWDIEAHGQFSHDKFAIDQAGTSGRFLTSKKYIPGVGLESDSEFQKRVEDDYRNCILDIFTYLNKKPEYFAIPLNDYGQKAPTNYPDASTYNQQLIKKYFRLAFIQANDSSDVKVFHRGIYNYADSNPFQLHRIEVKNMDANYLEKILSEEYPNDPQISWQAGTSSADMQSRVIDYVGNYNIDQNGIHLTTTPESPASSVFFGDDHWKNYTVEADVNKLRGNTMALIIYASDSSNYVQTGFSNNQWFIREYKNGVGVDLSEPIVRTNSPGLHHLKVVMQGSVASVWLDGKILFHNVATNYSRGRFGFKMYDSKENSEGLVTSLSIVSNTK